MTGKRHAVFSKATEAIVSEDGHVKRHLNNYETVVSPDPQKAFYVPTGAVNDTYGNLNGFGKASRISSVTSKFKLAFMRHGMYITAALVIAGFAWSIASFVSPKPDTFSDSAAIGAMSSSDSKPNYEQQLERIANLVIRDGDWTKIRMDLFLNYWNVAGNKEREEFKQKAWYQHFTYRLNNKFKQERAFGAFSKPNPAAKEKSLMSLALAMGIADPNVDHSVPPNEIPDYDTLAEEASEELAEELARVENAKRASQQNEEPLRVPEIAKISEQSPEPVSANQSATTSRKPEPVKRLVTTPVITKQDVLQVLRKYSSAYEQGDLKQLSSLFGINDLSQGSQMLAQLKQNYQTIFDISDQRRVSFESPDMVIEKDRAHVNSNYNARISFKNNKGTQSVTANANVELKFSNDQVRISRFELLDKKVSVVTPELGLSSANGNKRPETPTPAELQDIVTRFVGAYETGNITALTSLFTKDAKTNDRVDINGIKQDYQDLFQTTSDRQMFIQNMQWSFDDKKARGNGKLEAVIITQSGKPVYSMRGEIQITAQRFDDKVLITDMYHIEQPRQ
jgi:hypothetical protein